MLITLLTVTAAALPQDGTHPVRFDRTGIEWALPFEAARERARAERRLLLVKPVAFGTTKSGCW
jgi:hypothetical protein